MMKLIRKLYTGVTWRNPVINSVFKIIDIPDYAVRLLTGMLGLPKYSIRVRSRGVANQFGGALFQEQGIFMAELLSKYASLKPNSDVVEIGCGCGCGAVGLSRVLNGGSYRGMDIDAKSIVACQKNSVFSGKNFQFSRMDLYSSQYNPVGKFKSSEFIFPYLDESADIVFLTSVFTHMLPLDVEHYIAEISRILRPGGVLLCTVFLMDLGDEGASISFPYDRGNHRLHQETIPERAVGYMYPFFRDICQSVGLHPRHEPVYGNWRSHVMDGNDKNISFGQDILVFEKRDKCISGETAVRLEIL